MYKIKWLTMFFAGNRLVIAFSCLLAACGLLLTACGEEQIKSKVMLYQADKEDKKEESYETTTVKRDTYEEKISTTGELYYQDEKAVSITDSRAYVDKILVKNDQRVNKGDALAIYHVKYSDTTMQKKKLEVEQARSEYNISLKSKRNEVLEKKRSIKNLTNKSEKKIAQIQLQRLQREYKSIIKSAKNIEKQEKEYNELMQKRTKATLRSKYSGTVGEVKSVGELAGDSATGETLMVIRNEKNFLIKAEDGDGMRYNMTVDVGLGSTSDDIKYHVKGKVISTNNLLDEDFEMPMSDRAMEEATSQLIQIAKTDREKYNFEKYNIFIKGVSMKIEDALIVDASAVNEEPYNEDTKLFVYVVENDKLHKRYIVSNYRQEKYYLVNQGLQEGQTLAILSN